MAVSAASRLNTPPPQLGRLLVVDDEPALLAALVEMLTRQGYQTAGFGSGVEALHALQEQEFDLLLTDLMMPELDGIALLRAGLVLDPNLMGILMTGQGTVKTAVEAMKVGAFDYVLKPFKLSAVLPILARALDVRRLRLDNLQLRETVAIYELTQAIAYTLDLNTILNKTADAALQQCEADEASIMLPTPDGQELVVAAVRGERRGQLLGERVPIGEGIAGWVAREHGPLTLPGEVRGPRFAPLYPRPEIQSAVSIPMLAGNQLIGVLNVNLVKGRRRFTLGQVKALSILVSTAAAALENARLHAQVTATEERFRALIENSSDGIVLIDLHGRPQYASPSLTRILGYRTLEELLSPGVWPELVHPDDRPAMREQIAEAARRPGQLLTAQYRLRHQAGGWRWLEVVISNLLDQSSVAAIVINYRDVTERREAEAALRESEERFRAWIENSSDLISVVDLNGQIRYQSPSIQRLLGYGQEELVGQSAFDFVHPDDADRVLEIFAANIQTPEATAWAEFRFRHHDGSWRVLEGTGKAYVDEHGDVVGLINSRDITERKWAQEEIQRLAKFPSENPNPVLRLDRDGTVLYANPGSRPLLAQWTCEVGTRPPAEVCQMIAEIYATLSRREAEFIAGGAIYSLIFTPVPEMNYVNAYGRDITARKMAEASLQQTNDLLTRAEQVGHSGSWELNLATGREVWSDGLYRIFGLLPLETDGTLEAFLALVHPEDRERVRRIIADQMQDNLPVEYECRLVRPDGSQRVIMGRSEFIFDNQGEPIREIGIELDITERKQRERELEAVGAVSRALRTATTPTDMLPILVDQVQGLLAAEAVAIMLLDKSSNELVIEAARGTSADQTKRRMPASAGISGQVLSTGQAYVSDNVQDDPRKYHLDETFTAHAAVCVPMMAPQEVLGVIWVRRALPFAPEEVRILAAIADIAANAIQRAGLYVQTEQRLQRLAALRAIDMAISSSLDLRLTLNVLLDQVISQLHADAADVLLLNPATRTLNYAAGRGMRGKNAEQFSLHLGQGYAGRVGLERRRLSVPDLAIEAPDPSREWLLRNEAVRAYHGVPLIAKGTVVGVLEVYQRAPLVADSDWLDFLEALAGQAAIAIDNTQLFTDLQRSNLELGLAYQATIEGWSRGLDLRDKETEGHSQRVTEITLKLARSMGIGDEELVQIRRGALLHDIGKLGVPDSILLKPGPLTPDEWVVMRKHPTFAYEMLSPIHYLRSALEIPYCHHEKWDGTGYPRGLKEHEIPLSARLFAVVDVWDALSSDRPYRPAWAKQKVFEHIRSLAGTHFDPQVVRVALESGVLVRRGAG